MTDPIAAARAMIEPLTGYTPKPWTHHKCLCGHSACNQHTISTQGSVGFQAEDARLIAASPDMRDMIPTLADALEVERAARQQAETERDALVAAAYENAALLSEVQRREGVENSFYNDGWRACASVVADAIRTLTPADAQAALDKMLARARREGWRAGRNAAANEAELYSCSEGIEDFTKGVHEGYTDAVNQIVVGIRAMPEPKEANHG